MPLIDPYKRKIDYLRVSITDRCNLRCGYCMPSEGINWLPRDEILKYEEITRIVRVAVAAGISKVRISGGEPLLRRNLPEFIAALAAIEGLRDLSLTTNGLELAGLAGPLRKAGLQRINISLDSLNPYKYKQLTGGGELEKLWQGIEAAQAVGLEPLKINVVVLAGINEDEILDFVELAQKNSWQVRFIELRPGSRLYPEAYLPIDDIFKLISNKHLLRARDNPINSTARLFTFAGAKGSLGFIGKAEDCLCEHCNRMRLTSTGQLYPCLFSHKKLEVKSLLRQGAGDDEIVSAFKQAAAQKPARLPLSFSSHPMSRIGG